MTIKISQDPGAPTAAVELVLTQPLADYDIEDVDMPTPRDVDGILVSQGFRDLVDDARAFLERELSSTALEVVQLTGQICHAGEVHRPAILLVLCEQGAHAGQAMSAAARERIATLAEKLRTTFQLS